MKKYIYPTPEDWKELTERPHLDVTQLNATVAKVLNEVKTEGDNAVKKYEEMFDHVVLDSLAVSQTEMDEAETLLPEALKKAIILAHHNIKVFHESQRFEGHHVETQPGVECWQKSVAIERVGLYIPGGTAPLFSTVLMLATPAQIAGCKEIVLCTPPAKDGRVNAAILFAAKVAGVNRIFKAGGVQAIGAMAYGTESVPKVYKIFGPGNQYVMAAKQQVSLHDVAIDMPAGPSEVCVIADHTAQPAFVAADMDQAIELANRYAPEHLIIQAENYMELAERIVNAGSVFLGPYACESAGDYASGTNHTLPTHGYATAYSGVNLDSFCRKITFQHLTREGIRQIGWAVATMADAESLTAHQRAMTIRMETIEKEQN